LSREPAASIIRAAKRTSIVTRFSRCFRLVTHILRGLYRMRFKYPLRTRSEQLAMIRAWSRVLLKILGIRLHLIPGSATPDLPSFAVANHVAWFDPFVILAEHPSRFVGKAEILGWPMIGPLCAMAGTLFIERVKRRDAHRINIIIGDALDAGDAVAVFPEGTTTLGDMLLPFHANLLQAAIDRGLPLQPVALRYLKPDGSLCIAAAHVGEQTLFASLLEILAEPAIIAEIRFLPPIPIAGRSRRELAHKAEGAIADVLGLRVQRSQAETRAGRQAAPR